MKTKINLTNFYKNTKGTWKLINYIDSSAVFNKSNIRSMRDIRSICEQATNKHLKVLQKENYSFYFTDELNNKVYRLTNDWYDFFISNNRNWSWTFKNKKQQNQKEYKWKLCVINLKDFILMENKNEQ